MANEELKDLVDDIVEKSKDLFGQTTQKAGEYAKVAGDKVTELYGKAKARVEIEKIEFSVNKKFRELGKAYYTAKEANAPFDDTAVMTEIRILKEALVALKEDKPMPEGAEELVDEIKEEIVETVEEALNINNDEPTAE